MNASTKNYLPYERSHPQTLSQQSLSFENEKLGEIRDKIPTPEQLYFMTNFLQLSYLMSYLIR